MTDDVNYKAPPQAAIDKFLLGLTALSLKHGIVIGGCGCCGSPFLTLAVKAGDHYECCEGDNLSWESTR